MFPLFEHLLKKSGDYLSAFDEYQDCKLIRDRWLGSPTKPHEKYFDLFCNDMVRFFNERSKKPNYRLIASIANHFELTSISQTDLSIRQRFFHIK